jgi:hypothetical protein
MAIPEIIIIAAVTLVLFPTLRRILVKVLFTPIKKW